MQPDNVKQYIVTDPLPCNSPPPSSRNAVAIFYTRESIALPGIKREWKTGSMAPFFFFQTQQPLYFVFVLHNMKCRPVLAERLRSRAIKRMTLRKAAVGRDMRLGVHTTPILPNGQSRCASSSARGSLCVCPKRF